MRVARNEVASLPGNLMMSRRKWAWLLGTLGVVVCLVYIVTVAIDEPLRDQLEARMNAQLVGYQVRVGRLDVHPLRFALDLEDLVVRQQAHPEPPVGSIARLGVSVQWRALLHGRVVGDVVIDEPRVHLDLTHAAAEATDDVPVKDRGWQQAVEAIYPLKINELRVNDGDFTYIEPGAPEPVHVARLFLVASNIRNVKSAEGVYPSGLTLDAVVHETAHLEVDGSADFFAEPEPAVRAWIGLHDLRLAHLAPMAHHANVNLRSGVLSLEGRLEYAPRWRWVDVDDLDLDGVVADYVARDQSKDGASRRSPAPASGPSPTVHIERIHVDKGELGFVNQTVDPPYRLFLAQPEVVVRNVSIPASARLGTLQLKGRFMGRGATLVRAKFRPGDRTDVDASARIEHTPLTTLNDVLRSYGNFDVNAGEFSVYTELSVNGPTVQGYVKPIIKDLDVYDPQQDAGKSLFRKVYEALVGAGGTVFRNQPQDQVATRIPISGRLDDPHLSTVRAIVGIVRNAFIQAIRPGLEQDRAARR
jgi:hypothetical protein